MESIPARTLIRRYRATFSGWEKGNHLDVVADAGRAPEADHAARGEPFFGDDLREHLLRIGEQFARLRTDDRVVEDLRIAAGEFPRVEKR